MKRRTPPTYLTEAFHQEAMSWYFHGEPGVPDAALRNFDGGPACWLHQFDPLERPCSGELQAIHLISRQRIRNLLTPQLRTDLWADGAIDLDDVDDLVELAEWDPRLAAPGCTGHHTRFDSQTTPRLQVPLEAVRFAAIVAFADWALDVEAERKFDAPSPKDGAAAGLQQQPPIAGIGADESETARPDRVSRPIAICADSGDGGTGTSAEVSGVVSPDQAPHARRAR